jgi:hypothetical protein
MTDMLAIIGALALLWMAFHILKIVYDLVVSFFENRASLKEENRRLRLEILGYQQTLRQRREESRQTREGL